MIRRRQTSNVPPDVLLHGWRAAPQCLRDWQKFSRKFDRLLQFGPRATKGRQMLSSLLLYLNGDHLTSAVVRGGVSLALRHEARVRGLAIVDTRRRDALMLCESAAYAVYEHERLQRTQSLHVASHGELAHACLQAGVNFDIRSEQGDPLEILPREVQFHDLVVTGCPHPRTLASSRSEVETNVYELTQLPLLGVQPLLVLRDEREMGRVLLVYDGTPASGRAVKSFLGQRLWPDAEMRLLVLGKTAESAQDNLREMVDYLGPRRSGVETGMMCGSLRTTLVRYARKWQADLVVLGMARRNRLLTRVFGESVSRALRQSTAALYISG